MLESLAIAGGVGEEVLLTPCEAGRILGLTSEAVRALNNKGRLPALKTLGGRRLFRMGDVQRLAEVRAQDAHRKRGGPEQAT